ncbi:MAG: hypothetical protein H0T46_08240 [Deltaproteobacteria bacterium]|nr:hypothetical protein [Deltaproteobacteria bacterium]
MSRWFLVLVLAVASATGIAHAQSPQTTARAQSDTAALERKVGQVAAARSALAKTYAEQLEAIDRLKKQRASWRRDRELRDNLAAANDTATRLAAATNEHAKANTALATARRALIIAIDAELATKPVPARTAALARVRSQLAPQAAQKKLHRIVLPDLEVDPTADPEELEAQAAALRDSEAELNRQVVGLEKQARELDEVAKLRKQHERAGDLARRDDDQPQRTAQSGGARGGVFGGGAANDSPAPEATGGVGGGGDASNGGGGQGPAGLSGFESEATVVLSGVVDASTIDTLTRAQRSGDPAQRALAAKKARDAVANRLDQLRKKRAEIEAIVKSRNKPR